MTEYIDRQAVLDDFARCNTNNSKWTPERVCSLLWRQNPVEVAPVGHSKLGKIYNDEYYGMFGDCEKCGTNNIIPCNYCRICGAKMISL